MSENSVFGLYSHYYDLFYQDKDYAAEVQYVDALLQRYVTSSACHLLEFGSGTGRHGQLLAQQGYRVTGIELSREMVAQATESDRFSCQQGDIRTVRLGTRFDAVISLFHVMSYQVTNGDVLAVLQSAADHLDSGGLFLFDVWYTPAVYTQQPEVRIKKMANERHEITRIAEPTIRVNENRVDVEYTIFIQDKAAGTCQVLTERHPMRHFSLPEIELFASVSGFDLLCAEEFLTGASPGQETWGTCIVLRKK